MQIPPTAALLSALSAMPVNAPAGGTAAGPAAKAGPVAETGALAAARKALAARNLAQTAQSHANLAAVTAAGGEAPPRNLPRGSIVNIVV
jgi:hypothetical protein